MGEPLRVNNESDAGDDLNLEQNMTFEDLQLINTNEKPCDNQVVTTSCWDSIEDHLDDIVVFDTLLKQIGANNNSVQQPAVGMVFQSFRDIDTYLRVYGKQSGFVVVSSGQSYRQFGGRKTNVLRNSTWRCENADYNVKRVSLRKLASVENGNEANEEVEDGLGDVRKSKKCGCPVMFYASATRNDELHLKKAILVHENHTPSPSWTRYITVFRQAEITPSIRRRLYNDLDAGLTVAQIHRGLVRDKNDIENIAFTQRDIRNVVAKDKKKKVRFGDSNAMYKFLKRMSDDNELFFHNHRLDEHGTLKDVMWVDARNRVV